MALRRCPVMPSVRCLQQKVFKRSGKMSSAKYDQSGCSKLRGRHLEFSKETAELNFVARSYDIFCLLSRKQMTG